MSVKVENRPENRFQCYIDFERTEEIFLTILNSDDIFNKFNFNYGVHLKHIIYDKLIQIRTNLLTANSMNVYDDFQYPKRLDKFENVIQGILNIKSTLEMYFKLSNNISITKYSEVLNNFEKLKNRILNLIKSDTIRHNKGQIQVKKEYIEAKKHNFFKSEIVNHTKQDPNILNHKDPFNLKDLIFTDLNGVELTNSELQKLFN